jgi:hypothetical protein
MRRTFILLIGVAAIAVAVTPASADTPGASVKLLRCSPVQHEAAFYARMQAIPAAVRMGVRVTLLERTGSQGFAPVRAPGLGRWQRSRPGVAAFGYRQVLRNLPANAAHRLRVRFRWYGAGGAVVREAVRRSGVCRQFAGLPNLVTQLLRASRTDVSGMLRYAVRVENTGMAPAAGAPVRLTVHGVVIDTVTLAMLASGERRLLGFRGPACSRSAIAHADPAAVIVESSEQDNRSEVACADLTGR